jgi:hypothetical protein
MADKSLALIGNASGQDSQGARDAPRHFRSRLTTFRTRGLSLWTDDIRPNAFNEISASPADKGAYIDMPVLTVLIAAASCRSLPRLLSCQSNSLTTSGSIGLPSRAVPFHV